MKEPIRVLQIVTSLSRGSGVLAVVFNWHRHIDTSRIEFDYLYFRVVTENRQREIEALGGRCYQLPNPMRAPLKFLRESSRFFKTHRYKTIHSHVNHLNLFFLPLAKCFGVKNIIHHAHAVKWGNNSVTSLRNYLMARSVGFLVTHRLACSQAAGNSYYGKNFKVVNNGIEVEKFTYNPQVRARKRKELKIENNFVVGHVGRLSAEKNHTFLLDVFAELLQKDATAKLVLAGSGPLEGKIKEEIKTKGLDGKVFLLGVQPNVNELYQAFDCFVFPSLHEGLGIVAIEAQAAGLPCVVADTLPREVVVCNCKKLPLGSADKWAAEILTFAKDFERKDTSARIKEAGFCAAEVAKRMQNFYTELEK